jgi:hypothetical protein
MKTKRFFHPWIPYTKNDPIENRLSHISLECCHILDARARDAPPPFTTAINRSRSRDASVTSPSVDILVALVEPIFAFRPIEQLLFLVRSLSQYAVIPAFWDWLMILIVNGPNGHSQ